MTGRRTLPSIAASMTAAVVGLAAVPSHGMVAACGGSAVLEARVVANPALGMGAEVAAWDVSVPPCARVLVYQIVDADTLKPVEREAVFPGHTVRHERWEKRRGMMRLHLQLQNLGQPSRDARSAPKSERWTRRLRAVVRWFPDARGA